MAAPPARPHIILRPSATILSDWQSDWAADDDAWDSTSDSESVAKPALATLPKRTPTASASSLRLADKNISTTNSDGTSKADSRATSGGDSGTARVRPLPAPIPTQSGRRRASSRASTQSQDHNFSFTHVVAPSPSSYNAPGMVHHVSHHRSSKADEDDLLVKEREQAGWVRIRTVEKAEEDSPKSSPGIEEGPLNSLDSHRSGGRTDDVESEMVLGILEMGLTSNDSAHSSKTTPSRKGKEVVRSDVDERVRDPFSILRSVPQTPPTPFTPSADSSRTQERLSPMPSSSFAVHPADAAVMNGFPSHGASALSRAMSSRSSRRRERLIRCLSREDIDMAELVQISWQGIPADLRPIVWQLLLTYLPLPASQRLNKLHAKRQEFASLCSLTFSKPLEPVIWHQIEIDVPRTRPGVLLWADPATQRSLERILYLWAIKHPASGYVQGINDLVTPFFQVFLSFYVEGDPTTFSPTELPPSVLAAVEADSFWCLSNLLDGIQMNYIHGQPGIVASLTKMSELVRRIDHNLAQHLEKEGVEYMQFAFRWMNCLLMRELSVENTIRMWDTYMCEGSQAFSQFHLFVCTAFLLTWSKQLQDMDFQGMIMFLQSLPTQDWTDRNIEELMGKAWQLSNTWKDAQGHLNA